MSVRTQPPPDEYSDYAYYEDQGFAVEWVENDSSRERVIESYEHHRVCRRIGCRNPVAWALLRGHTWWFYCADHHYGRKIEDGKLLHRRVVSNTDSEPS